MMIVRCAVLLALAVMLWPDGRKRAERRLEDTRAAGPAPVVSLPRVGIAQVVASAIARMQCGGTLQQAFREQSDIGAGAMGRLTAAKLADVFAGRRLPDETMAQAMQAAQGGYAASIVSDRLGCKAAPCLEAVLAAYRHMRLTQNLRSQAFAVPKATVGLLSALPAVTVVLGELMGARPLAFLLGSRQGLVCLALGGCCYAAGLAWMRALMRDEKP